MNRKQIQALVAESYQNGLLQEKIIGIIASKLTRRDLKQYIAGLKAEERKHRVTITAAHPVSAQAKKAFADLFPDKEIVYQEDPSLVSGITVQSDDLEYKLSITQTLAHLQRFLVQTYDR